MENDSAPPAPERPAVRVRPFAPADRGFVLSLAPRLVEGIPAWRDSEKMRITAEGWLTDSMNRHGGESFVYIAEAVQGELLGFATVAHSKHFTGVPQAELGELAVREDVQGRGVGQALVAAC